MSNNQHTPGPWNWDAHGRLFARETVCPWPLVIAQGGAIDADMRLIAAAPALLAALDKICRVACGAGQDLPRCGTGWERFVRPSHAQVAHGRDRRGARRYRTSMSRITHRPALTASREAVSTGHSGTPNAPEARTYEGRTMDKGYNGWTNYETWNAKLWIDNDQGEQEYWEHRAMECLGDADGDKDEAVSALAREMELSSEDNAPEVSGVYADLLNAALGRIEWREIAQSIVDDVYDEWRENNPADDDADEGDSE